MRSSSKKATLKLSKINFQIVKENVKEKSVGSFTQFFLNQYGFDSKKKKMWALSIAEKMGGKEKLQRQKANKRLNVRERIDLLLPLV